MQRANPPRARWYFVFFAIALLVVIADQLSKAGIESNLSLGESLFDIGFFRIVHVQNTGAAFGMFRGQPLPLAVISIVGAILILLYAFIMPKRYPSMDSRLSRVALGLILGGTVGNLVDRLQFGAVTDFLDFIIWPAFNVADSAVTVGVIIFAYSLLLSTKGEKAT